MQPTTYAGVEVLSVRLYGRDEGGVLIAKLK